MEVEYTLRPEDFQAFARYHLKQGSSVPTKSLLIAIAGFLVIAVIWGVLPFLIGFVPNFQGGAFVGLLLGNILGGIGASLGQSWWKGLAYRAAWKVTYEDPQSEWTNRVILSPEQLHTVTQVSTSTYRWSVVCRIAVTQDHVFLYLTRGFPITRGVAILIPRRAFRDISHFEEFIALARRYRQGPTPTGILTALPFPSTGIINRDVP
jgi:hypothetical protein